LKDVLNRGHARAMLPVLLELAARRERSLCGANQQPDHRGVRSEDRRASELKLSSHKKSHASRGFIEPGMVCRIA